MEFWGVEVKAGKPLKVNPDVGTIIHISQAALGEGKKGKGNDIVPLRVNVNGKKFVVGSLSAEKFPQVSFDLVFEKEFELSHDWKDGSVYFCGYSADNPFEEDEDEDEFEGDDSDEDEDTPLGITGNGKIESKGEEAKPAASKGKATKPESHIKPKVTVMEPKKDESDEDDESEEDDSDDDKVMMGASDDSDSEDEDVSDDEDDSDEEDEETPKKAVPSKKRPTESATKTPVPAKKAKLDTPQKTDGKKGGGHSATPHPAKQAGKTPNSKSKEKSPKSDGKVACKSCNKTFNSETGLDSHKKAKHGGK